MNMAPVLDCTQEEETTMRTIIATAIVIVAPFFALPTLATDRPDLRTYPPRDSYERQLQDYQRYGYDSQRNGPLQETLEKERRDRERHEEEYRRDTGHGYGHGYGQGNSRSGSGGGY